MFALLQLYNLQLLVCTGSPLSLSCRWSWSSGYQFLSASSVGQVETDGAMLAAIQKSFLNLGH